MTGLQVHRVARRGSARGIAKVLERLVSSGLVLRDDVGGAALYSANRRHLAWPAVVILMQLRTRLIERMTDAICGLDPAPEKAVLFGSVARGDGDDSSDVDVLVVHPGEENTWGDALNELADDVHAWTGNHVQWVTVSDTRWSRMVEEGDPLVESVNRDGVSLLSGGPT